MPQPPPPYPYHLLLFQGTTPTIARSHGNSCAFEVHDALDQLKTSVRFWCTKKPMIMGMFVVRSLLVFRTYRYLCRQNHRLKSQMFGKTQLSTTYSSHLECNQQQICTQGNRCCSAPTSGTAKRRHHRLQKCWKGTNLAKTYKNTHSHETKHNITNQNSGLSHPHIKKLYYSKCQLLSSCSLGNCLSASLNCTSLCE